MQITNFSTEANIFRSWYRPEVDKLFIKKEKKLQQIKKDTPKQIIDKLLDEAEDLDLDAREMWQDIIKQAEMIESEPDYINWETNLKITE